MNLGTLQVGGWLPLRARCLTGSAVPTLPSSPVNVYATIYSDAGAVIDHLALSIMDRYLVTAHFGRCFQLDGDYSAGHYFVLYTWAIAGTFGGDIDWFEVVAGGSASGAVVSAVELQRPEAKYLVHEYDSGTVAQGRNPS